MPQGGAKVQAIKKRSADVVQKGGSNQKNQNKMAGSQESVTGKYFRCIKVFTRLLYVFIDSVC